MWFPPLLAHGTLGALDEVIFVGVAATFLIMMGVSWVIARRSAQEEDAQENVADPESTDSRPTEPSAKPDESIPSATEQRDHFPLA